MASGDVVNTAARLQAAAPVDGVLVDETTYRATSPRDRLRGRGARRREGQERAGPRLRGARVALAPRARRRRAGADARSSAGSESSTCSPTRSSASAASACRSSSRSSASRESARAALVTELFRMVAERPGADRLAPGPLAAVRRGRDALGARPRWSRRRPGSSRATAPPRRRRSSRRQSTRRCPRTPRRAGSRATCGGWSASASELDLADDSGDAAFAAWRRFFEGVAERGRSCSSSKTSSGPTTGCWTSSTTSSTGPRTCPCSSSARRARSSSTRRPAWGGGKPNATTQSLAPLSDDDTARLVHGLLDRAVLPAELQSALVENAGGNPLYAEEFARMLAEREEAGPWASSSCPETVQGIIAARLDGLTPEEKALLQDASVIGKVFWLGSLAAMDGVGEPELERRLHGLERRELVRRERQAASPASASTPSGTCSSARSRTGRSRAPRAPRSTGRRGVDRVARARPHGGPRRDAGAPLRRCGRVRAGGRPGRRGDRRAGARGVRRGCRPGPRAERIPGGRRVLRPGARALAGGVGAPAAASPPACPGPARGSGTSRRSRLSSMPAMHCSRRASATRRRSPSR